MRVINIVAVLVVENDLYVFVEILKNNLFYDNLAFFV